MSEAAPNLLDVGFTVAFVALFAAFFIHGTWLIGRYGRRNFARGESYAGESKRHDRRVLLIFVVAAGAFIGMIASSPERRAQFCRDTRIWPGCSEAQ